MDWSFIKIIISFIAGVYNAGGAKIRWVVWIWCAFIFLYVLLGKYDSIHKKNIIGHRHKAQKNYFYALHLFGIITVGIEYGYLLYEWDVFLPIAKNNMVIVCSTLGYIFLLLGFCYVLLGRLYLNSYWGKDIYRYENPDNYKLVQECIYQTCRHPIYFGQVSMCVGTALVLNNILILVLAGIMLIVNICRARREDKFLYNCFKEDWRKYQSEVSFFIPFL